MNITTSAFCSILPAFSQIGKPGRAVFVLTFSIHLRQDDEGYIEFLSAARKTIRGSREALPVVLVTNRLDQVKVIHYDNTDFAVHSQELHRL